MLGATELVSLPRQPSLAAARNHDGRAVLKLGEAPRYGLSSAVEIHVEGAEQAGAPQNTA